MIVLFKNKELTIPVNIELTDFSAFATTGMSEHTQTVDTVEFKGYTGTPLSPSYATVSDGTTIAKNMPAGQPSIFIENAEYYIKPNMKMIVTYKEDDNNIVFQCEYYVGQTELTAFGTSHTFSKNNYFSLHVGAFKIGDKIYYGFYLRIDNRTLQISTVSENYWDGSFTPVTTSPAKTSTKNGGRGAYDRTSAPWTPQSQWANAKVLNRYEHGIHCYKITAQQYNYLHETLWGEGAAWAVDMVRNAIFNPISGIIACHALPVDVPASGSASALMICGRAFYLGGTAAALTQQCQFVSWQTNSLELSSGDFSLSYLDWAPYLTAMIKLPFIGWKELDVNTIMDGSFYVRYVIDIINGNCLAEIWVHDRDGHEFCYGGYSGNCAYTVPITANDQGGIAPIKAFAGMAATSIVSGTLALAPMMEAPITRKAQMKQELAENEEADSQITSMTKTATNMGLSERKMTMASDMPANIASMTDDLQVHLVLTGPNNITPLQADNGVITLIGKPTSQLGKVKDYRGDNKEILFGIVHADNIPKATAAEKNEIEDLIEGGVIL